jgi:putative nucleotidyltransferase with HDIG domain
MSDSDRTLKRYIAIVGDLPAIPAIANQVMQIVGDSNASAEDVRQIIERDPALAARILKVANSSLYSFRREVETLQHGITLLGFRTVMNLVMAASLRDVFKHFGLPEKLLWEHSTIAGAIASTLASYGPVDVERESAFTASLLHDLGKIALSNTDRPKYNKVIMRTYNEGIAFVDAERDEFGFDHAELGAHVAEKWRLAPRLVRAIRHHHDPPEDYAALPEEERRLIALTSVVTRCCTRLGVGRRAAVEAIDVSELPAWGALGLGEDDVEPVLTTVTEEAKQVEGLFG